jgi:hypothetical protein
MPLAEARRRGYRRLDDVDELPGALDGLLGATADDAASDLPRVALLAVRTEYRRELSLVVRRENVRGAPFVRRIHPHVEWRVGRVREAPLWAIDLHRREAEVEQDCIRPNAVARQL